MRALSNVSERSSGAIEMALVGARRLRLSLFLEGRKLTFLVLEVLGD